MLQVCWVKLFLKTKTIKNVNDKRVVGLSRGLCVLGGDGRRVVYLVRTSTAGIVMYMRELLGLHRLFHGTLMATPPGGRSICIRAHSHVLNLAHQLTSSRILSPFPPDHSKQPAMAWRYIDQPYTYPTYEEYSQPAIAPFQVESQRPTIREPPQGFTYHTILNSFVLSELNTHAKPFLARVTPWIPLELGTHSKPPINRRAGAGGWREAERERERFFGGWGTCRDPRFEWEWFPRTVGWDERREWRERERQLREEERREEEEREREERREEESEEGGKAFVL